MSMADFEARKTFDICCDYKYVAVLCDQGEIFTWGKYLISKYKSALDVPVGGGKKKKDKKSKKDVRLECVAKFPQGGRFPFFMDQIFTGSNHSCAITNSKNLFVWGYNSMTNRLGVETL